MSSEKQNAAEPVERTAVDRIVVALDASPQSVAALQAAAELCFRTMLLN